MFEVKNKTDMIKPFLKWAGGKTQLLEELSKYIPLSYNKYIEAFLGGGALFFFLKPKNAILADANPELINCYKIVRDNIETLIVTLNKYENEENFFYKIRSINLIELNEVERAARFIYLNRTCFNGLYRENKKGEFNVPFGKYKNPNICDEERLYEASNVLKSAKLICADYKAVLRRYAQKDDFVFLDPPYFPVGGYADFQRYTKEFFYEEDHIELRDEVNRLIKIGAKVMSTNSNADFINELYKAYPKQVIETKRLISSKASTRTGQDLIIYSTNGKKVINSHEELLENFPGTRFMGSKYKILPFLWDSIKHFDFNSALDAFSGSGCVSYMLKQKGIEVYSNDFMSFSSNITKALVENSTVKLSNNDLEILLQENLKSGDFISVTFDKIYFEKEDNEFLDNIRANIDLLDHPIKRSLALASIVRACMKKRPRGIFTYVGQRYDDGRRDLQLSLKEHFLENVESFNSAVFNNGRNNKSFNKDIFELNVKADLVYFDPPYLTSKSDNDYIRRYHFVEGLVKNWEGLTIEQNTKTKKFKKYPSPFDSKSTVNDALDRLFKKHQDSILVVSYSSNSIPAKEEMIELLKKYKKNVELKEIDYQYSFGNQNHKIGDNANKVKEYIFIAS
ncbi:MAG: DNA adenine methylase [Bacteroidetes bacterium GWE2_42_24]|nr:MAG: DNA adenine methylase [Bacteroidetes bacterium GWE2_42_24]OFY25445.1 MAG: DNA adenine methylase [Bacteroidetes bacterium GWF2_43_11]HCT84514.1 DNA adenine methylase [Candidatus Margulisiibacteriota bacterium]